MLKLPVSGYVHIDPEEVGFSWVDCEGSEGGLEECDVSTAIALCSQAGIVRQCLNGNQLRGCVIEP